MKKAITISFILIFTCLLVTFSFASTTATSTESNGELISNETKSQLIEIKENELKSIEDYNEAYGGAPYGLVAYIINKVRIFSIPLAVLGIAICSIYEYVIGHRHIENRQKDEWKRLEGPEIDPYKSSRSTVNKRSKDNWKEKE